jgi:hypothetical protein
LVGDEAAAGGVAAAGGEQVDEVRDEGGGGAYGHVAAAAVEAAKAGAAGDAGDLEGALGRAIAGPAPSAGGSARERDGGDLAAPASCEGVDDPAAVALGQVAVVLGDEVARLIGGDGVDLERGGVAVAQGGGEFF